MVRIGEATKLDPAQIKDYLSQLYDLDLLFSPRDLVNEEDEHPDEDEPQEQEEEEEEETEEPKSSPKRKSTDVAEVLVTPVKRQRRR